MIRNFFLFLFCTLFLAGCAHETPKSYDLLDKTKVVYRFQNMLALQTHKVGCSLGSLGGIELMTQHASSHPADLTFQIGPAFYPLITGPFGKEKLKEERGKVWREWEKQKVAFYSVDALDLDSDLSVFNSSAKDSSIQIISSNILLKENGTRPFLPFLVLKAVGKEIAVLSFTEVPTKAHSEETNWTVQKPVDSFLEVRRLIPSSMSEIFILGSLEPQTRKSLAKASKEPLLFLGGTRFEKNLLSLKKISQNAYWAKSPDYGMGYSELTLEKNATPLLGGLGHKFFSGILNEENLQKASCEPTP